MHTSIRRAALAATLALACAAAQATPFTYHGSLDDGGRPAEGRYDLRVTPFASERAVAPLAEAVTLYGVEVRDGRFSAQVDFARDMPTPDGWIGVAVRKAGDGDFVELAGRSEINGVDTCWSTTGNAGLVPGSFIGPGDEAVRSWTELLYLSIAVLSSVGLSDILPATPMARALVMLESIAGIMFIALVVSRLICLYVQSQRSRS